MTIGNNILALLYQRDISQKQMAIDLDIAPSTLNGYINARREPDYDTLIKFAQYFLYLRHHHMKSMRIRPYHLL